ncbi:Oxo-4-hydroxy-4-carboxy-5-ureidoimidazoline decarboxylase [Cristinia sonorae]|uniref:Oxo-4-hydroxy-4-carboxy-5-ureidoimidazoline decarboxylase n=1 Tax=Cristinia sonorae TaxID=1940300 RepID=A0A8K0XMN1_9AGAR|nr:Oxo-4-hydroxy-4-carboxy-5-ureidoimidazoline decarboxylase [Cristinia sonorae]
MSQSTLVPLSEAQCNTNALSEVLVTFFEDSAILRNTLVPQLSSHLRQSTTSSISSYSQLIDVALGIISTWDDPLKAEFIEGHPRIGEQKGLSHLSAKEQAAVATRPEVLLRLAHLNQCYEHRYHGLRYITFVNGRPREMIVKEMEGVLGFGSGDVPNVDGLGQVEKGGEAWREELERAVYDVGQIAKSRLKALGVE